MTDISRMSIAQVEAVQEGCAARLAQLRQAQVRARTLGGEDTRNQASPSAARTDTAMSVEDWSNRQRWSC